MHVVRNGDSLQAIQNDVLERVATGEALADVADALCRRVEGLHPEVACSIVTCDEDGILHFLAGPSLSHALRTGVEGAVAGPRSGSCGTAVFRGEPVTVRDIATDPLWDGIAGEALENGFRACWSSPIKARDGRPAGAFAFYYRSCAEPSEAHRLVVARCVHLSAIAIEPDRVQRRIRRLAFTDGLTGLANRLRFDRALVSRLQKTSRAFGLLLIDIDHLKAINDTMGHGSGDILIRAVASRLGEGLTKALVARLSGDEFAVLFDDCSTSDALHDEMQFVRSLVCPPLVVGGQTILPQVTIGGVLHDGRERDATALLQCADLALYHAKEYQRGGFIEFSPSLRTSMLRRTEAIKLLSDAISDEQVRVHYQAIHDLNTRKIIALEALARIDVGDGQVLAAGEFAEAFTDPAVAYRLTDVVLAEVARDIRKWLDLDISFGHVAVNVGAADFGRGDLVERIMLAFEKERVPPRHMMLEVTETVHMAGIEKSFAKVVERLRASGILVALDDFGTGHASLTHLIDFPVDVLKIDKSFVDGIETGGPARVIATSLIDIAGQLGMWLIAEGIETSGQLAALGALGCRFGQGYGLSRPEGFAETSARLILQGTGPELTAQMNKSLDDRIGRVVTAASTSAHRGASRGRGDLRGS
jgi:diguanylate cyclase (GGDEF)-like protein